MHISANHISRLLASNPIPFHEVAFQVPDTLFESPPRRAAVLILFQWLSEEWHLVFIRRTSQVNDQHAGQVAFPGGRIEETDPGAIEAALREAEEEIGIHPSDVSILGTMPDIKTVTNFQITPIIGQYKHPFTFKLQHEEVARVFTIPLKWLADPGNFEIIERSLTHLGKPIPVIYYKEYNGEMLWGASAKITYNLLRILNLVID